jgi:phenylpropionate dioxygenase-like ring-hydroxylating dioxygenase large terminal subunit
MQDSRDFPPNDPKARSLVEVRCESIGELNFINFDDEATSLADSLGSLIDEWRLYEPENSILIGLDVRTVKANYKLVQEANMEVTHVPLVHPQVTPESFDYKATALCHVGHGNSIQATRARDPNKGTAGEESKFPETSSASELSRNVQVAFNIYPNIVSTMNAWGYPLQCYWPIDADTTQVEVYWIAPARPDERTKPAWDDYMSRFAHVLEQDFTFCEQAQRSVHSPGCRGLLMGCMERTIYYQHEEMDRRIGLDRVPIGLRVKPVISR